MWKKHERNAEWLNGFKSRKSQHKTEWYQNNNWDDNRISQKDTKLEKARTRWSSGLLAEELTALYEHIATQIDIISNREDIPKWITLDKTVICQKDPSKGNAVDNYRPILGLAESIYNFLDVNDKLSVE